MAPEPYTVSPGADRPRRRRRRQRRPGARDRAALPGPHRAAATLLLRRRSRRADRLVRAPRTLGHHPTHLPLAALHRDGAGLRRQHHRGASAGLHLRLRGRRRQVPARAARRRAAPAIPVQRNHFRQVGTRVLGSAGALGLRGSLQHAGRGVAGADRAALSEHRLGAAEPRHHRRPGRATSRRKGCSTSTTRSRRCWTPTGRRRNDVDADQELGPGPRRRRRGAVRGLPALPLPRDVEQEPIPLAVRCFGAARRGRRRPRRGRHPRGAVSGRRGPGRFDHRGGAVPAVAAPPGRTRTGRRRVRAGRRTDHPIRVVADLGRSGRM